MGEAFWTWRRGRGTEHPRLHYVARSLLSAVTHVPRLRQLPTNHNHACSAPFTGVIRVYQSDSPSRDASLPGPERSRQYPEEANTVVE